MRLERIRLGSGHERISDLAAVQPLFHRRKVHRHVRTWTAGPGAQLARIVTHQQRSRKDADSLSEHGKNGVSGRSKKLALPTRTLPRLLRRLYSRAAYLRNRA